MSARLSRREALASLLAGGVAAVAPGCGEAEADGLLRPPTAGDDFLARCVRCFRCGEVCTAGCIEFHPAWASPALAGTPFIQPRVAACNTCMRCTHVCPSGALTPVPTGDRQAAFEATHMGTAYVDQGLCLSYLGRVCGVCHDACPYPGQAIRLLPRAQPEVLDACVGCGRCEERCPQTPAAIRVFTADPGPRWTGPGEAL